MFATKSDIDRMTLEIEKLRQDIETALAQCHHWDQQQQHWRIIALITACSTGVTLL